MESRLLSITMEDRVIIIFAYIILFFAQIVCTYRWACGPLTSIEKYLYKRIYIIELYKANYFEGILLHWIFINHFLTIYVFKYCYNIGIVVWYLVI